LAVPKHIEVFTTRLLLSFASESAERALDYGYL